ncbi:MAG: hypothetical protein R3E91_01035 [Chlamydiales bacterium]
MKRLSLFLLFFSLHANENIRYAPWLPPLWEMQKEISYSYSQQKFVQSPKEIFLDPSQCYTLAGHFELTPWPYWNIKMDLLLTQIDPIPFSYQAVYTTIRYQWFDDIRGDPITLTTGITLSFPGKRYLHNYNFPYHGEINSELHATIGKEWTDRNDWWMRGWVFGGWGIANRGNGWLHGIASLEFKPKYCDWGFFTEALFGLGSHDIVLDKPFVGYALIHHKTINIGSYLHPHLKLVHPLSFVGWYNPYAYNFVFHNWGVLMNMLFLF